MQGRPQPELRYHVRNGLFLAIRSPRTRLARRTSKHTVQVCLLTWLKRGATVCKNSNTFDRPPGYTGRGWKRVVDRKLKAFD